MRSSGIFDSLSSIFILNSGIDEYRTFSEKIDFQLLYHNYRFFPKMSDIHQFGPILRRNRF